MPLNGFDVDEMLHGLLHWHHLGMQPCVALQSRSVDACRTTHVLYLSVDDAVTCLIERVER
jgi:hypothetical protein